MKNLVKFVFIFTLSMLIFNSCAKKEEEEENPDTGNTEVLWTYDIGAEGTSSDDIPAIDASGNIYGALLDPDFDGGDLYIFSIDKNGNERWKRTFTDVDEVSKVVYSDNKVFFLKNYGVAIAGELYCIDAATGADIWVNTNDSFSYTNGRIAVSDSRIYTFGLGTTFPYPGKIFAFDYNGVKKADYLIDEASGQSYHDMVYAISVKGNSVYYALYAGSELAIGTLTDNGNSLSAGWLWNWGVDATAYAGYHPDDLPIDDDGNAYMTITNKAGDNKGETVVCIGANGEKKWQYDYTNEVYDTWPNGHVTIDADGTTYVTFLGGLHAITSSGNQKWIRENTFYDETEILKLDYQHSPTIAANGNTYHRNSYGIVAVNNDGSIKWKFKDVSISADHSTINIDGNIIIIGQSSVVCYKGDNSPLATGGWAKKYGTLGNTCSK